MLKFKKIILDFEILKWLGYSSKVVKIGKFLFFFLVFSVIFFSLMWSLCFLIYFIALIDSINDNKQNFKSYTYYI